MVLLTLCLALLAFMISLPLTRVMIGLGERVGQLDVPDAPGSGGRKSHARATPNTGGVAVFAAIVVPVLLALAAAWLAPASLWSGFLEPAAIHMKGLREQTPAALGLLGALLVMHVMGLVDDRKRLGPFSKLMVQLAVAFCLVVFFEVRIFEFLGRSGGSTAIVVGGGVLSILLSMAWIVVITNAMNFLDNMDGLSGGVGCICAALYFAATLIHGQWFVAALAALLVGALLGFLVFNFPPARVFMGDGGSLVVGLLLAVLSVRTTYIVYAPVNVALVNDVQTALPGPTPGAWYGLLMPLMVLAIPLYDFTSVTLIRLAQGKSPFVGDQNHFSHRLVRKGLSKRSAVIVIWLCTLATGLGGVMLGSLTGWQATIAAAQSAAVLVLLAMLERGKMSA